MTKHTILSCCILLLLALTGCERSDQNGGIEADGDLLRIRYVRSLSQADQAGAFTAGDSIGVALFLKSPYRQIGPITKYVLGDAGWASDGEPLRLTRNDAYTVYAFYPYDGTVTDIASIPAHSGLSDFFWARTEVAQEHTDNGVALVLEPALTYASFNVILKNYNGQGDYQSPQVSDFGGVSQLPLKDAIFYYTAHDGQIDLSDKDKFPYGQSLALQLLNGDGTVQEAPSGTLDKSAATLVGEMKLPPVGFGLRAGLAQTDLKFGITIDGRVLWVVIPVPANSTIGYPTADGTLLYGWEAGKHYKYTVTLTAYNLTIGGITVDDWDVVIDLDDVRGDVTTGDWGEGGSFETNSI